MEYWTKKQCACPWDTDPAKACEYHRALKVLDALEAQAKLAIPKPRQDAGRVEALEEGWTLAAKYILGCMCQIEGNATVNECVGIVRRTREAISKAMLQRETMEHGLSLAAITLEAKPQPDAGALPIGTEVTGKGFAHTGKIESAPCYAVRVLNGKVYHYPCADIQALAQADAKEGV